MQDSQLLQQYIEHESQSAFSRLVERHLNMVYSTCYREIGDATLAEDATQVVFLLLAQKARTLRSETVIAGWLFQTARFAGSNARRQEQNRLQREQKVVEAMVQDATNTGAPDAAAWAEISPLLNEAMGKLNPVDRNAVLLRCFEGHSLRETGLALGLTEDAAGKRVNRALEKLRRHFTRRRIALSLAALALLLSDHAVQAAPASCTATAMASLAAPSGATVSQALSVKAVEVSNGMSRTGLLGKSKIIAAVACAVVLFEVGSFGLARRWAPPAGSEPAQNQVIMRESQIPNARTNNKGEDMQTRKKFGTALAGAVIATAMSTSAFASDINARVKTIDAPAHTITVIEGGKLLPFVMSADTKYTDGKDRKIKFEGDPLASPLFKDGTRLSIKYEAKDASQVASIVKLRDYSK